MSKEKLSTRVTQEDSHFLQLSYLHYRILLQMAKMLNFKLNQLIMISLGQSKVKISYVSFRKSTLCILKKNIELFISN